MLSVGPCWARHWHRWSWSNGLPRERPSPSNPAEGYKDVRNDNGLSSLRRPRKASRVPRFQGDGSPLRCRCTSIALPAAVRRVVGPWVGPWHLLRRRSHPPVARPIWGMPRGSTTRNSLLPVGVEHTSALRDGPPGSRPARPQSARKCAKLGAQLGGGALEHSGCSDMSPITFSRRPRRPAGAMAPVCPSLVSSLPGGRALDFGAALSHPANREEDVTASAPEVNRRLHPNRLSALAP